MKSSEFIITEAFLAQNPQVKFVFGDNTIHEGCGGAAKLRYHAQAFGVITKRFPGGDDEDFFKPDDPEFLDLLNKEIDRLQDDIVANKECVYFVSKLGAGLANRFNIWPVIREKLITMRYCLNETDRIRLIFLFDIDE